MNIEEIAFNKGYVVKEYNEVINTANGKRRKLNIDNKGYLRFTIAVWDGVLNKYKMRSVLVHRLYAYQKFGYLIFDNNFEVRHLDGNKLNNSYENLLLGSHQDNMLDVNKDVRLEKAIKASSTMRKFSDSTVRDIKRKKILGYTYKMLMEEYDISSKGTLYYILKTEYVTKKI